MSDVIYSDVSLFAGTDGDAELVFNEHSINQNILLIAATPRGSKWWRPEIGSNLHQYLFDPIDSITADNIQRELQYTLESNLEARVVFNKIEVLPDVANQNFYVNIEYKAARLGDKRISFEFALGKSTRSE